jgi:hypothetical protein
VTRLGAHIPDVLIVLGLVAVTIGVLLVSVPAGVVVGGVLAVGLGTQLNADRVVAGDGQETAR